MLAKLCPFVLYPQWVVSAGAVSNSLGLLAFSRIA